MIALSAAGGASANSTQRAMLQDDRQVLYSGAETRNATLDELRSLGADTLKIGIQWRDLAPEGASKPAGFDGSNPGAYADAKWAPYDDAIEGAQTRGMEVLVSITGPAPDWASQGNGGVRRPDAAEFGAFVRAVGTRYSGAYPTAAGTPAPPAAPSLPLPGAKAAAATPYGKVTLWSVWNEPNLPRFLLPQRASNRAKTPVSPHLYRALYNAARDGLSASGHGGDTILIGELLPVGRSSRSASSSIRPLEFLRELGCVSSRFRAFKGRAARQRGCDGYKALAASGLAYHPYTLAGGPRKRPPSRDDASIGTLSRVTSTLDRLASRKRISPRRMPLWLTEFGFQTDPPDPFGTSIRRVPAYMGESEYIAFRNRRVASWSQYPLVDDRSSGTGFSCCPGFQSGLHFQDGKTKPGVYTQYRFPIHVVRTGRSKVTVFGGVRTAAKGAKVTVEARSGRRGKWKRLGTATLNDRGYFRRSFSVGNPGGKTFRFRGSGAKSRGAGI